MPKITVIIVVFNGAKTLEKAIQSVLGQSYQSVELVVIDGGSTDNTLEILKANETDNLSWISEPDKGIYDAMNKGIKLANGEWIYFLGADDELYNKKILEILFKDSGFKNIEFLYGNVQRDDERKPYDGEFNLQKLLEKNISHQAIFYNKNLFQKIGDYNLKYRTHADWDLNIRCFENEETGIKYIDKIIARFNTGGASADYDKPFLQESLMPKKMKWLKTNKRALYNLKNYDEWWRFIRNAGFRTQNDFAESGHNPPVPGVILSMVKWQHEIPEFLLRKGVFSKISMFVNYLFNLHKITN